jgi:phage shock protein A
MQRRIGITAEIEKWVARLNAQVNSVWRSNPATNTPRWLLGQIGFWVARPGLDAAYQRQLVALARTRRAVAGVATSRKRLELQIGDLERRAETPGDERSPVTGTTQADAADQDYTTRSVTEQLADLRRRYADIQAKEERVSTASRQLMAEIDAFRTGKKNTEAAYKAAEEASKAVHAEIARSPTVAGSRAAAHRSTPDD